MQMERAMTNETAIHRYLSEEFHFSDLEIARIRYAYITVLSETSKILFLFFVFHLLHMQTEFLISIAVLLSIRNFTGGIHLHHYTSCLAFTFLFLFLSILLSRYVMLPAGLQALITAVGVVIVYKIGGVSSDKRPDPSPEKELIFKMTACVLLVVYTILFLCVKDMPWKNLMFWVIVLQIMQLAVAKRIKERRKHYETQKNQ